MNFSQDRLHLADKTRITQKLQQLLSSSTTFQKKIQEAQTQLPQPQPFQSQNQNESQEDKVLQGRDFTVCIRARPLLDHELQCNYFNVVTANNPTLVFHESKFNVQGKPVVESKNFNADMSFGPQDDNDTVYLQTGRPLVQLALQGGFGSMFAYGQTGSGKTFTMQGIQERISHDIFQLNKENLEIHVGFFQLLGNKANDLLKIDQNIEIMEDTFGKVQISGMQEHNVHTPQQFLQLIKTAQGNRRTQATFKNDVSSRTHSICQIRVKNPHLPSSDDGLIYLIDLVGSENASDSQFHDKTLFNETKDINKSLMALKECIRNRVMASVQNKHIHVPFRQSKLTLLLKDSFDMNSFRQSKTIVLANIAPSVADQVQTLNTLKYATPIKVELKNTKKINKNPSNPQFWDNETLVNYFKYMGECIDLSISINGEQLFPYETGKQAHQLSEPEFIKRFISQGFTEKQSKDINARFFKKFIDTRFEDRQKLQARVGKVLQESDNYEISDNKNLSEQLKTQWEKDNKDLLRMRQIKKHANRSQGYKYQPLKKKTTNQQQQSKKVISKPGVKQPIKNIQKMEEEEDITEQKQQNKKPSVRDFIQAQRQKQEQIPDLFDSQSQQQQQQQQNFQNHTQNLFQQQNQNSFMNQPQQFEVQQGSNYQFQNYNFQQNPQYQQNNIYSSPSPQYQSNQTQYYQNGNNNNFVADSLQNTQQKQFNQSYNPLTNQYQHY